MRDRSLTIYSSQHYWKLTKTHGSGTAPAIAKKADGDPVKSPAKAKTPRKKKANGGGSEAGTPTKKRKISKAEEDDADDEGDQAKAKDDDEGFAALVKTQKANNGEDVDEEATA